MANIALYALMIAVLVLWGLYTYSYDRGFFETKYRKYLNRCYKVNIKKPFTIVQYYLNRMKERLGK